MGWNSCAHELVQLHSRIGTAAITDRDSYPHGLVNSRSRTATSTLTDICILHSRTGAAVQLHSRTSAAALMNWCSCTHEPVQLHSRVVGLAVPDLLLRLRDVLGATHGGGSPQPGPGTATTATTAAAAAVRCRLCPPVSAVVTSHSCNGRDRTTVWWGSIG